MMLRPLFAVTASLAVGVDAFWRMECPGRVGLASIDPIVNPGAIAPHIHAIHGSSGFSQTSSTEDLLAGDCTSCRVTQDKSAYWHPAFYFQDADTGKFELVPQVGGMLAYYLLHGDKITAFPPGFQMLSGTTGLRTYSAGDASKPDPDKSSWASLKQTGQDTLAQRALGFNCLNYGKQPEGTLYRHYLPDKSYLDANCADGIRFEIMFPSCWKGGDAVDSENHKDHVAFPDLVMTGNCPESHPVRLPSLMYEVIWNTAAFKNRNGNFTLSNGDPTGYGLHADFIMGWDEKFLQKAIDTCRNPSGRIQDCPVFDVVSEAEATTCELQKLPEALKNEDGKGPLLKLPGGGPAGGGSEPAKTSSPPELPVPSLTYKPGEYPSAPAYPLPGQVFKESSSANVAPAPTSTSSSAPAAVDFGAKGAQAPASSAPPPPPPPPPATTPSPVYAPVDPSISYFSTQYVTKGNVVNKILWEEQLVYVTKVQDVTKTVTATSPPSQRRRRMAHLHAHGQRRH